MDECIQWLQHMNIKFMCYILCGQKIWWHTSHRVGVLYSLNEKNIFHVLFRLLFRSANGVNIYFRLREYNSKPLSQNNLVYTTTEEKKRIIKSESSIRYLIRVFQDPDTYQTKCDSIEIYCFFIQKHNFPSNFMLGTILIVVLGRTGKNWIIND